MYFWKAGTKEFSLFIDFGYCIIPINLFFFMLKKSLIISTYAIYYRGSKY